MLISYNWLREYVPGLPGANEATGPNDLARALTMSGTEVESTLARSGAQNVVTAEILSVGPHPNADKLSLCEVKTDSSTVSIVCAAKNMKAGDKVALALAPARLPDGHKIKKSKIRGVESQGMMCSEVELGIRDTSDGIMILTPQTPLGLDINDVLGLEDAIMEVGITPNRADLLSVRGLGRETGAVTGAKFIDKEVALQEGDTPVSELATVNIEPGVPCRRYSARVIKGVKVAPSSEAMKARLSFHGIRPVNNVVDATNYVLIETGQPLHAFDLAKLDSAEINVRNARSGETLVTIDGTEVKLDPSMLAIADAKAPAALAGVMGGRASEVTGSTTDVLLESAWFEPVSVRRTSKKTAIATDSSYRFERGTDIEGVTHALDMAAEMIRANAGGSVARGRIDVYPEPHSPEAIEFRTDRAAAVLGIELDEGSALEIFSRLGLETRGISPSGNVSVAPPSYRRDLCTEIDLMEEVARLHGYDKISTDMPRSTLSSPVIPQAVRVKRRTREVLALSGLNEVVNYGFVAPDDILVNGPVKGENVEIKNPLSEDASVMRTSLIPSLLTNLRHNIQRGNPEVRIFELAPVFTRGKGTTGVGEQWMASALLHGARWSEAWNFPKEPLDFFDVKGLVETLVDGLAVPGTPAFGDLPPGYENIFHPGRSASLLLGETRCGVLGELHPDLMERFELRTPAYLFELDLDILGPDSLGHGKYSAPSRFPASTRDIAFVIDEKVPYRKIFNSITGLDVKIIETVELFDVYYGKTVPESKRSIALRVVYRSLDKTLTAPEVEEIHARVAGTLVEEFGAEIRGA